MSELQILSRSFKRAGIPGRTPQAGRVPMCGVYLLTHGDRVVYVGSSYDIETRLWSHQYDKDYDGAIWLPLPLAVHGHYEGALVRRLRPEYNGNAPRNWGHDGEILYGLDLISLDDLIKIESEEHVTSRRRRMGLDPIPDDIDSAHPPISSPRHTTASASMRDVDVTTPSRGPHDCTVLLQGRLRGGVARHFVVGGVL